MSLNALALVSFDSQTKYFTALVPADLNLEINLPFFESSRAENFLDLFSFKIISAFEEKISFIETNDVLDFCVISENLFKQNIKIFEVTIPSFDKGVFRIVFSSKLETTKVPFLREKIKTIELKESVIKYFNYL